jgi:threonine dehydrogenase-like Zn-dependent dehydrogenase
VRGLVFRNDLARQAATFVTARVTDAAYVSALAPVRIEEVADPVPPAEDWTVCDTVVTGICGSDAKQIFLNGARDNPLTSLISFPHILGHEAVGRRRDTGGLAVLNPWLYCGPRGIDPPCDACAAGKYMHCRNFTRGILPPGIHLGNCAGAAGTHADRFAAAKASLFDIPGWMSLDAAVLADPVSVSLHSILKYPPRPGRPAVVYGCGTLGLAAVGLLRHRWPDVDVWAISRPGRSAELAADLGAAEVLIGPPDHLVRRVSELLDVEPQIPWSGRPWLLDGAGVVYDTVGSPETVETSLRLLDTEGGLVISGVEKPKRFEWTPLYFKEITIVGSNAFGVEDLDGVRKHAFEHYFDMCAAGLDLTPIITHRFALDDWAEAIRTIANRDKTGAVKVLLEP